MNEEKQPGNYEAEFSFTEKGSRLWYLFLELTA
jgi:hypothetical protein